MLHRKEITVVGIEFSITIDSPHRSALDIQLTAEPIAALPHTYAIRLNVQNRTGESFSLHELSIEWSVPAVDMHGFYTGAPRPEELASLPYWRFHKESCANTTFPFIAFIHRSGENRFACGLLDQLTETALEGELSEATRAYHLRWHKPLGSVDLVTERWRETLFVSLAPRPWPEILQVYIATLDREWPQPKLPVPAHAYDPVFCTWTAIHHDVSADWVLRNAPLAADLGFRTWLTDDGWFTDQATFADYRFTGDWKPCPSKFPDFRGQVCAVQAMGLHYVLWVAPFMVGDASQAARRYAHLVGEANTQMRFRNLSPRRAETCQVIGDLLVRLVSDYHLDGLKIDFVDAIGIDNLMATPSDYATLGAGVYDILSHAIDRVQAVRPDALIEFRNPYANLASRRYANQYRASDVPMNFALNRWQVTMLRLLAPERAVLLDPALWHRKDSDENVAVHLINAITTVPIVSVELDQYPQSHLDLIRYWIGFYQAHRDTIIHGKFFPELELGTVPLIRFDGAAERIIGLYGDIPITLGEGPLPVWILNASTHPFVDLLPEGLSGEHVVTTRDKFGRVVVEDRIYFPVMRMPVQVGGSLEIRSP